MTYLDTVDPAVVLPAMDANMATFWSEYGRSQGCVLERAGDAVWFHSGIPHPFFNGVPRATFSSNEAVEQVVNGLAARIAATGAPAFWWVGPFSSPDGIGARLEASGIRRVGSVPAMAIDLTRLGAAEPLPAGLSIERVESAAQQSVWGRTAATGSDFTPSSVEALAALEGRLGGPDYRAQYRYIGFLDGRPVASSAMVLDAGVAGIYAVATLPDVRQRGIGMAMSVRPLYDARDAGYRVAVLQASPAGFPIYRKIGFVEVAMYGLHLQAAT